MDLDLTYLTSCDFVGDSGCCNPDCWQCHSGIGPENLRTLAKNLVAAAALCRAWQIGRLSTSLPRLNGGPAVELKRQLLVNCVVTRGKLVELNLLKEQAHEDPQDHRPGRRPRQPRPH